MALSELLGFLSLAGYVALLGRASWLTWRRPKSSWGFSDHGFDKMPEVIEVALRTCLNRGFIVIEDRDSEHFVQFRKYILRNGEYGLELGFPEAPWSKAYVPKLRDTLTADGLPFRETREFIGDVTAFIHVDCGQDIDMAVDLTRRCFFDIFGLASDSRFKSSPSNVSALQDHVDNPDYENSSLRQFWPAWRADWRAKGLADPKLLMTGAAFTVGFVFCYPALWWAWVVAHGALPDWQVSIGSLHLAGSDATLILLAVFCALFVGTRGLGRKLLQSSTPRPLKPIERFCARLVAYALPLAVVTSWLGL